jgi:hypothetical protein
VLRFQRQRTQDQKIQRALWQFNAWVHRPPLSLLQGKHYQIALSKRKGKGGAKARISSEPLAASIGCPARTHRTAQWAYKISVTSELQDIVRHLSSSSMSIPPNTFRVGEFSLYFVDETLAKRVCEAFLHAASLCRDKKEPF